MQVSKATSSIRRLFTSLDIHYNNILNTEVEKQMNLNKETSNKSCQLNNFRDSSEHFFFSKHQGLLNVL